MTQSPRDITVIGAGIIGMTAAVVLQRDGHKVTVIDAQEPGQGCSFGHAGAISPGSCVPMAMPGMLSKVPGWLLDPLSPLAVRWRYFPKALPWLLRWAGAGRLDRVRAYSASLRALNVSCMDGYRRLLGNAGFDDLFRVKGQLYIWEDATPDATDDLAQALREQHGVRTEALDAEGILRMVPCLAPIHRRGLYLPDHGHTINPLRVVETLAALFAADGGSIRRAQVTGFDVGPDGPRAVRTEDGEFEPGLVVVTAGAWSHRLAEQLGSRVPLEAERGYHVMLPAPGVQPGMQIMNRSHMMGVTPMENGLRIAGTVEIAGVDAAPDYRRAEALLGHARRMFQGLDDGGAEFWMGCRPSFPDSLPVIDRSPHFPSVCYAFGHSHFGLSGAPMTATLLADLIAGRPSAIDRKAYAVDRF